MAKSRWEELYPRHPCLQCGLIHAVVPILTSKQPKGNGEYNEVQLAPFEILGSVDGPAHPGKGTPYDTPAHIVGLLWGHPGQNRDIKYKSITYLN